MPLDNLSEFPQGAGSFGEAFSAARSEKGPGSTFDYGGKSYTTDRADDPKPSV